MSKHTRQLLRAMGVNSASIISPNTGLQAHNAQRAAARLAKPCGLTYDLLHEIRRAMRTLRRAEKWIMQEHKAAKRRARAQSGEWQEAQRIFKGDI